MDYLWKRVPGVQVFNAPSKPTKPMQATTDAQLKSRYASWMFCHFDLMCGKGSFELWSTAQSHHIEHWPRPDADENRTNNFRHSRHWLDPERGVKL